MKGSAIVVLAVAVSAVVVGAARAAGAAAEVGQDGVALPSLAPVALAIPAVRMAPMAPMAPAAQMLRGVAAAAPGGREVADRPVGNTAGCTTQTLYTNSFEGAGGFSDFVTINYVGSGGSTDWRGVQTCGAHSGSESLRFGGAACDASYGASDFGYAAPLGGIGIAVPVGATNTTLSFWHQYDFATGTDGGTLAISVDGVNSFYVPVSAITSGATYNGNIGGACPPSNSAGAAVFTGSVSGFVNTTVDLDAACNFASGGTAGCAGRGLYLEFVDITGCAPSGTGWMLDDVTVTACTVTTPTAFFTVPPCRALDTRTSGGPLTPGNLLFQLGGQCGIPTSAKAVSANVTVVSPQAGGFLTLYPGGSQRPATSTLNMKPGVVTPNNAVLPLAANESGYIYVFLTATTQLLIDVNGYFQ